MNDSTSMEPSGQEAPPAPLWRPVSRRQRRVLGVLVEKAKTTPDQYPLSLNALTNGCNQKSNRSPEMSLTTEEVEEQLDALREMGAVTEVQSGGRVAKYKHRLYEWLGVNKVELAVMAELLLRGEQTLGDLRGRANRMEPIGSVSELTPIVQELTRRGLILELGPAGRGQIVSHALYEPAELEKLKKQIAENPESFAKPSASAGSTRSSGSAITQEMWETLQSELNEIRAELQELRQVVKGA